MRRFAKKGSPLRLFCSLLFLLCLSCSAACAENAGLPDVTLDLTGTGGALLVDQLTAIRLDPATWTGTVLRVRGQYYAEETEDGLRHMLIVSDCAAHCSEVALLMVSAPEAGEIPWPENNQDLEIVAVAEPYDTAYGPRSRLVVLSALSPASIQQHPLKGR